MKVCPKCGTQYGDDANFCTADAGRLVALAASAPTAAPAASGMLGGRFQLGPRIGGGATGAVHRGTDVQSGAPVAIKLIALAVLTPTAQGQRVERELKLLERVHAPEVARVLASGKHAGELWVATEWVDGCIPLSAQVEAGVIDSDRAAEVVAAVGAALLDAAKVGLVHRDLSPDNVLVVGDAIKVINFAIPTPGERVPGVPGFVAPEAIEGKPIDQRSTTYSLGALTYYLLTGQPPFVGEPAAVLAAHLAGGAPPPSSVAGSRASFDAVVGRAMDRNPARRYLTLKQFLDDVNKARTGGVDPGTTAPFGRVGKGKDSVQPPPAVSALETARTTVMDVPTPAAVLAHEAQEAHAAQAAHEVRAAHEELSGRRASAPTIQTPAVPPVQMAAPISAPVLAPVAERLAPAPVVEEQAAPRRAALVVDEALPITAVVETIPEVAVPSPWSPPVAAGAARQAEVATVVVSPRAVASATPAPVETAAPKVRSATAPGAAAPAQRPRTASAPPGGATGKKKPQDPNRRAKGKFRETLWFKKGELDAAAAEAAAKSKDGAAEDKVDTLPMEERYTDDGSVTSNDAERYSLKTGHTSSMPAMSESPAGPSRSSVSEDELISELKRGRRKIFIAIALGAAVIAAIIVVFVV